MLSIEQLLHFIVCVPGFCSRGETYSEDLINFHEVVKTVLSIELMQSWMHPHVRDLVDTESTQEICLLLGI